MRALYVDTGGWIALVYRRDRAHGAVSRRFAEIREEGALLVTSEPAVGETVTRLRYDAGLSAALAFRRILGQALDLGYLRLRETDASLREAAFDIMERYGDLRLSYADCIGAAVAHEIEADGVLGLDHDFRILGFELEPSV